MGMGMWPFAKRGSRFDGDADEHFPSDINPRDFKDNKAIIKLWLPSKILAGVDIIGQRYHVGRPDVLRAILFEHVFGRAELVQLDIRERRRQSKLTGRISEALFMLREPENYDTARAATVGLIGKAEHDLKLELPIRLRDELVQLAEGADQAISEYIRGVLVRQILGEALYQRWVQAMEAVE
jgi:hypothetical protein